MPRCACAIPTKWWKPASNPTHGDYCSQVGRTGPWAGDRPSITVTIAGVDQFNPQLEQIAQQYPRETYNDGVHYGTAWPTMDLSAFVLESSFDLNRDPV